MTPSRRRVVLLSAVALFAVGFAWAYWLSLVPATHPDHDHGMLNLDAGGHLNVTTRDGKVRNLVGRPGKTLVLHFFSTSAPGAAEELAGIFRPQEQLKGDPGVEFVLIAHDRDFATLDAWLKQKGIVAPAPASLVPRPDGRHDAEAQLEAAPRDDVLHRGGQALLAGARRARVAGRRH